MTNGHHDILKNRQFKMLEMRVNYTSKTRSHVLCNSPNFCFYKTEKFKGLNHILVYIIPRPFKCSQ